jgi:TolB protein
MRTGMVKLGINYRNILLFYLVAFLACASLCKKPPDSITNWPPVYSTTDCNPDWSQYDSTIAFSHVHYTIIDTIWEINPESTGLWFINPDGSNKEMFLNHLTGTKPQWRSDGQWIAFGKDYQIWKIKVSGDSLTQLTFNGKNYFATWSPDGQKMAVERLYEEKGGIWIMDDEGSEPHYIGYGCLPDWSPDGKRIAFYVLDYIGMMDTNGANIKKIITGAGSMGKPAFSPDGSKIAFGAKINEKGGIYVIDTTGKNLKFLVRNGSLPSWSPDGKKIVFVGYTDQEYNPRDNGVLYIINADGTGKKQLTFGPEP